MMLLGCMLSPISIGFIEDRYDRLTAFQFLRLFALFGAAAFFVGSFFCVRDLRKAEKVRLQG